MTAEEQIKEIREAVEYYFIKEETKHDPFDERNVAHAGYSIHSRLDHVNAFFHVHKDKLVIRIYLPIKAREEDRAKVGEFLHRANYGLSSGSFDFDFDDGEISYRTCFYCGKEDFVPPTYEQIDFTLMVGLLTVDRYADALAKVIFGLVEPEDAIEEIENADD